MSNHVFIENYADIRKGYVTSIATYAIFEKASEGCIGGFTVSWCGKLLVLQPRRFYSELINGYSKLILKGWYDSFNDQLEVLISQGARCQS